MGLDLQLDGLTAGAAGHCQPDKVSERKKKCCPKRKNVTSSALMLSK